MKKEKEKEENIWRREIYGLQRKRKTKKEKEENIWSGEEEKTAEGKGGQYFGEGKKEERIGSIFYFKFTFFSIQFTMFSRRQDGAESQKPRQRVSNADRKVFANPESFCNKLIIG